MENDPKNKKNDPKMPAPYEAPAIVEDFTFEREALIATCNELGVCDDYSKLSS